MIKVKEKGLAALILAIYNFSLICGIPQGVGRQSYGVLGNPWETRSFRAGRINLQFQTWPHL